MGIEYWAPNDVEIPDGGGPFSRIQQDFTSPNALFEWERLALFDSANPNFLTNRAAPNYSTVLPAMDAVGGKLCCWEATATRSAPISPLCWLWRTAHLVAMTIYLSSHLVFSAPRKNAVFHRAAAHVVRTKKYFEMRNSAICMTYLLQKRQ
jgi:hypothetical protein